LGLDIVEMILEIEDEFDIRFVEAELQEVETVWDLHLLVCGKLGIEAYRRPQARGCPSSRAFYRLRSAMVETLGVPRRSIAPRTRLTDIPRLFRRWRQVGQKARLRFPARAVNVYQCAPALLFVLAAGSLWAVAGSLLLAGLTALAVLIGLGIIAARDPGVLADPISSDATMREFTERVMARNPHDFADSATDIRSGGVWEHLVKIVQDNSGHDRARIIPEARFEEDLGMG
jgi:acyl carrier protein